MPIPRPAFRDYLALEMDNGQVVRVLGAFHAKVGTSFEKALERWPEVFKAGRGQTVPDRKAGVVDRLESARG
jgi:hypothetical protein